MTELTQLEQALDASSIAKWQAYPAYRDSGIEWLGEIPEHWEVRRLKYFADVSMGQSPDSKEYSLDKVGIPFLQGNADFGEVHPDPKVWCGVARKFANPSDILLSVRAPVGELNISDQIYGIGRGLCAIAVHYRVDRDYLWFLLKVVREGLLSISTGTTYEAVSVDEVKCLPGLIPSLTEQRSIAIFLDRETSKINTLIAKKQRLIELLQEKRAALISHAVTKGLDPDVKMRDSGVEWLGEIPEHWEVRRLKFCLTSIEQGWSPPCENRPAEIEEWGVLKVGCVNGVNFNSDENKALPLELDPIPELEIKSGDVLMSRANTRELLGSASLVMQVRPRLLLCDKLYRLKLIAEIIHSVYFVFAMGSHGVRFQMERDATGASNSMQNISQSTILNLVIPMPDIAEQQAIVFYLEHETARIDALITKIGEAIEKLKEYSAALISAAVTGKIDVRGEVASMNGLDLGD